LGSNSSVIAKLIAIGNADKKCISKKRKMINGYFKLIRNGFEIIDDALLLLKIVFIM